MNAKKAFSLTELVIVIAVIAVLATVLIIVIPKVIDKANQNSAFLDAENSYKTLCTDDTAFASEDMIICVSKGNKDYIFGYINDISRVFPAHTQVYALGEASIQRLLSDNVITKHENSNSNYAVKKGVSEDTVVYLGYRLENIDEQVAISQTEIELIPSMEFELTASALPHGINDIVWKSMDTDIVEVTNGTVIAKQLGKTEIEATSGKLSATCKVEVRDYTDFAGTMSDFKEQLENDDRFTYLRLQGSVISSADGELFPIVIPLYKTVNIDMNSCILNADVVTDNDIDSMIKIAGGKLYLQDGGGSITAGDCFSSVINNTGSGLVSVDAPIHMGGISDNIQSAVLHNTDGTMKLNLHGEMLNTGKKGCIIRNGSASQLSVTDTDFRGTNTAQRLIYNEGVITNITACDMSTWSGTIIENRGKIEAVTDCNLTVDCTTIEDAQYNDYSYAVINSGEIKQISGGEFVVKSLADDVEKYVFCLKDGTVNIESGKFSGDSGEFLCKPDGKAVVSGGELAHSVPKNFLAEGCHQVEKDGMFVVEK